MKNREILTLQFGNYANYVGTHFWNIQEAGFQYEPGAEISEIDHNITFREGQNHRGDMTYTPRMLCVDLKGSLGHLSEEGDLYADESMADLRSGKPDALSSQIPWNSQSIEVVEGQEVKKSQYQMDLDSMGQAQDEKDYAFSSTVESWSDFMHTRYHPRSVNIIREYNHSNDENSFDTFTNGRELWRNESFGEDFSDKIRQYIEECDNCQGFQVFFDAIDGFSGLTARCFDELNDEYGKTVLAYPLIPPHVRNFKNADAAASSLIRIVNLSMSFVSLIESVSLFVPLSTMAQGWRDVATSRDFPNITYNQENFYQTSAILATFLETISLKYRAKDLLQPMILADFCSDLSAYGWKMSAANLGLPFNMSTACDTLDQPKHIFTHLTPNSEVSRGQMMQTVVRGIHRSQIAALEPRASSSVLSVFPYADASLKMQKYLERFDSANVIPVMTCETPMPVKVPYPEEIFAKIISAATSGSQYLAEKPLRISSIPVLAGITSTKHLMGTIDSLHVEAEKVKLGKLCRFRETGLESDEYTEVLHKLLDFRDLYDDRVAL